MTWDAYGEGLEARLRDLESRIHLGSYRAQPSLRAYIPKPDGRQRPLGLAALEDKIVQRAVVEVLNAIYEQDFIGFSYGFRSGRSQHDALDALPVGIGDRAVRWILDADIKGFFDNISHEGMMRFVELRVGDRRVLRLIRGWLTAGVVEDGVKQPRRRAPRKGPPSRRCWRTSIFITPTIYGRSSGEDAMRRWPWSWCDTPTIRLSVSSIGLTQARSWHNYASAWRNSLWSCTPSRLA